jgi:RimJ/RimL family protein N-acetyltransferase
VAINSMAVMARTGAPIALASLYAMDLVSSTAKVAVYAAPEARQTGVGLVAAAHVIDAAFASWPLRKIYAEAPQPDIDQYGSVVRLLPFVEEGRLRAHERRGDAFVDMVFLALYREDWPTQGTAAARLVQIARRRSAKA